MKKIQILLTIIAAVLLIASGCSNVFFDKPKSGNSSPEINVFIPEGYGAIRISFVQGAARTAMPDPVLSAFNYFEYLFSKDGGEPEAITPEDDLFILEPGDYQLTVKAYVSMDETRLAAQGNSVFTIIEGEYTSDITVTLRPFVTGQGTGTLRFGLSYPSGTTVDTLTLSRIAGDEVFNLMDGTGFSPVTLNGTLNNIPVGYYLLDVLLRNTSGAYTGKTEVVHIYQNLITQTSLANFTFSNDDFRSFLVVNANNAGIGSLRNAINGAQAGHIIKVMLEPGSVIELASRLEINKDLTIWGNGIVLTRSASWSTSNDNTQLLYVGENHIVNISRIHFKNGHAANYGSAIHNIGELTFESCIFSGNQTTSNAASGGAVYNGGDLILRGCTFYGNSSAYGGAIYNDTAAALRLTGNLFYGNTAVIAGSVVYGGTVVSVGFNVVDKALGTGVEESGWIASATGIDDIVINELPLSPKTFKVIYGSEAANVITESFPSYPKEDFYGNPITIYELIGAAAGAVQGLTRNGIYLDLTVNNSLIGSIGTSTYQDSDGICITPVTLTAIPVQGYGLLYWIVNGNEIINTNQLDVTTHSWIHAVYGRIISDFTDHEGSSTNVTLRYALNNAADGDIIWFNGVTPNVTAIELIDFLPPISRNITIEGNGIVLTPSPLWNSSNTRLLTINSGPVRINRVHFLNGIGAHGGAIFNRGNLTVQSSIFSGNQVIGESLNIGARGGAIYNEGTLTVKGCTFYKNSNNIIAGAAICTMGSVVNLTGNLFFGNTAAGNIGPAVYSISGPVNSHGYNAVDAFLGTTGVQSGWNPQTGDKTLTFSKPPVSPTSFRLLFDSDAANSIAILPDDYPTEDFYGNPINNGAAIGAVQSTALGYYVDFTVNDTRRGSIITFPEPNDDGLFPESITLTVNKAPDYVGSGVFWMVDGEHTGNDDTLILSVTAHTKVRAVIGGWIVTDFDDNTGSEINVTLRYALNNAEDGDVIFFDGVTPGTTTIELTSALPALNKNIIIEGNGITLTRSPLWNTVNNTSQLLRFTGGTITIRRIHFKNGRASNFGGAINSNGTLIIESCIFSGNQVIGDNATGGAIYGTGIMTIKGCTFYRNSSSGSGGVISVDVPSSGRLNLIGNLFYENTVGTSPVVSGSSLTTSQGYNAVDVQIGTGSRQSGWTAVFGDKNIDSIPISLKTFRLLSGSATANVLAIIPMHYPERDFYGDRIIAGAAAGAVQAFANINGYYLDLSVANPALGNVETMPEPDVDGVYVGSILLTAYPQTGYSVHWWVDNTNIGDANPLNLDMTTHTGVRAEFVRVVSIFTDAAGSENTPGTLRHALVNAVDGDIIRISGVTPGSTTISLNRRLEIINKSITIEGNGVIVTRGGSMPQNDISHLLFVQYRTVTISRIHFRGGLSTSGGAAIRSEWSNVSLESCIFSGNRATATFVTGNSDRNSGGAIYSYEMNLTIAGCTFYNNFCGNEAGVIYKENGTLTSTGNIFYSNTATNGYNVVRTRWLSQNNHRYNVIDLAYGPESNQSGWHQSTGDTTFATLGITGVPFNITTFVPVDNTSLRIIPSGFSGFPSTDFYGNVRTFPAVPGAVRQP
ncbi:MAG: hypothetical protein FWD36_01520 [Treponema sp.]|nr:hypothetical protein [Treponema sp.]